MKASNDGYSPHNIDEIKRSLMSKDELSVVLKGHLFLEAALEKRLSLSHAVVKPNVLKQMKLGFYKKVQLAEAVGVITEDLAKPIFKINEIRNNYAHNSRAYVSQKKMREVYDSMPSELKAELDSYGPADLPIDLLRMIFVQLLRVLNTIGES